MRKVFYAVSFCLLCFIFLSMQETFSEDTKLQDEELINVLVGETKIIKLPKTTDRIDLEKRGVVEVLLTEERALAVKGISAGFTSVLVRYSDGTLGEFRINVTAQTPEYVVKLSDQLRDTLKNVKGISINPAGSNIVISGTIKEDDNYNFYKRVISLYSDVVMDMVKGPGAPSAKVEQPAVTSALSTEIVQIDVQVVQIKRENDNELGIKWFPGKQPWQIGVTPATQSYTRTRNTGAQKSNAGTNNFSRTRTNTDTNADTGHTWTDTITNTTGNTATLSKTIPDTLSKAMTYSIGLQAQNINFELIALCEEGKARFLATPKLIVQSGKTATFTVGGEIPIAQSTGFVSSVDWKKYGTTLTINPQVLTNGDIFINLDAEISELDWQNKVGDYPALIEKSAVTNITAKDNEMFAIAGLVSYEATDTVDKVPLLGDIPILGLLFSSKKKYYIAVETMMFFTPHIIKRTTAENPTSIIPSQPMNEAITDMQLKSQEVQEEKKEVKKTADKKIEDKK